MMCLNVIALNRKTCSKPHLWIVKKKNNWTWHGKGENLPKLKGSKKGKGRLWKVSKMSQCPIQVMNTNHDI